LTALLLIEDDPNTARLVHKVLRAHPYEIYHAATGTDGLKVARNVSPEIVLVDMKLPDTDGLSIIKQLFAQLSVDFTTVIAFTADTNTQTRRKALELGCDDLITKPIDTRAFPHQIMQIRQRKAQETLHG
jgi:DNA-binding response OmpR family regulator